MKSTNEIEFLRLLRQCQNIANQKGWRFEKYVDALIDRLDNLRSQKVNQLNRDTLEEYERKTQFLRGLIETEKLPSAEKRLLAAEFLSSDRETKALHLIAKSKYYNQMRQYLIPANDGRRKDKNGAPNWVSRRGDVEQDISEDLTENLRELTNNIRETMLAAGSIIQKDTETLASVSDAADNISGRLDRNLDKLESFIGRGFQLSIWLWLLAVTFTFFIMIMVIRLNPKPLYLDRKVMIDD